MEGRGKKESRTAYNEMACSAADNVLRRRMLMAEGDQKQRFHFYLFVFVAEPQNKLERGGVLVRALGAGRACGRRK